MNKFKQSLQRYIISVKIGGTRNIFGSDSTSHSSLWKKNREWSCGHVKRGKFSDRAAEQTTEIDDVHFALMADIISDS